jgi:histidyl-tRNA synthetase
MKYEFSTDTKASYKTEIRLKADALLWMLTMYATVQNVTSTGIFVYRYCSLYECGPHVKFDPSLARGLDYYTGVIYEAVSVNSFLLFGGIPVPVPVPTVYVLSDLDKSVIFFLP